MTPLVTGTAGPLRARLRLAIAILEKPAAAWTILIVSLLLTFVAWLISNQMQQARLQDQFSFHTHRVADAIEERMLEYEQVLRGGVGLFASSQTVSRQEWETYVKHCKLSEYFPGIQAMGVSVPVTQENKAAHETQVRQEGFPDYEIRPGWDRDFFTSIIYIEPFDWRNQRAFGFDMYSEPTRRQAMDQAIETGEPSMSGMVVLVQETNHDIQRGFLFYLPMFKSGLLEPAKFPATKAHQRDELLGFVYAAFRIEDLMQGIVGNQGQDLGFEIYDSRQIDPAHLLYDSDSTPHFSQPQSSAFTDTLHLKIRGRDWTLYFESGPELASTVDSLQSTYVAFGGLTVDFLLFLVIAMIGQQKRRALELAGEITTDLRAREELIRKILSNVSEAIVTVNQEGSIELANEAAKAMLRMGHSRASGINFDRFLKSQTWESLIHRLTQNPDEHCKCTVEAVRQCGQVFTCRLNISTFHVNENVFYIVVAQDETDRIASERKLNEINNELMRASLTAGKVELTNGVLHNVGNVINSINISTSVIKGELNDSAIANLNKICMLIEEHEAEFVSFVQHDRRGRQIPGYLLRVRDALIDERSRIDEEFHDLLKNVTHMKEVITLQQNQARLGSRQQLLDPRELLDDAVVANKALLANHDVEIIRQTDGTIPEIMSDKHQILQVLVNLIKNANDALIENQTTAPRIIVRIRAREDYVDFEIEDNGVGIPTEKLNKVFKHGFTTKSSGHGFGLHSSFASALKLGGTLSATSDGPGCGATFNLSVPVRQPCLQ